MVSRFFTHIPWWFASIGILTAAVFIKASEYSFIEEVQLKVFDNYQRLQPRIAEDLPVKIIDIDEESLKRIGQWPWPRTTVAKLTAALQDAGAAAIAYDIIFAEPDRTSPDQILPVWGVPKNAVPALDTIPDHDMLLSETIRRGAVISAFVMHPGFKGDALLKASFAFAGGSPLPFLINYAGTVSSLPAFEQASSGNGAINSEPDRDGVLRKVPLLYRSGDTLYPSLAAEALRVAQGATSYVIKSIGDASSGAISAVKIGHFVVPTDAQGKLWIYYSESMPERYIPAWKIIEGTLEPGALQGIITFIGTSAAGLKDIRSTPLNPAIAGVEVHVQALEQTIAGTFLQRPDWIHGAEIMLMVVAGIILIATLKLLNALWGAAFMLIMLASAAGFSWYSFTQMQLLVEPVTPALVIIVLYFFESLRSYMREEKEKAHIRNAFSRYLSPSLAEQLASQPDALKLGGENRELTVMFSDIRSFSAISESMPPEQLTQFMNAFLTPMTDIIMQHQGTIDKYMGDCIMAFWNAPLDDADHAQHGTNAALLMIEALQQFNKNLQQKARVNDGMHIPVRIGIGLNTGVCCVGNMGSEQRFDYSALGNPVDIASRLEGQCKYYGVDIILGENTASAVQHMALLELDLIRVKGKHSAIHIYTTLGGTSLAEDTAFQSFKELHIAMLNTYRAQEWRQAQHILTQLTNDQLSASFGLKQLYSIYNERVIYYTESPPPEYWDGVYVALTK